MAHQSSCRIPEADVAGLFPRQGSLLHLCQVCAWSYRKRMMSIWVAMFPDLSDEMAVTFFETCAPKK